MSKEINLEKILVEFRPTIYNYPEQKSAVILAMKEACRQTLELAAKNAKYEGGGCFDNGDNLESIPIKINKKSILNTINQIE